MQADQADKLRNQLVDELIREGLINNPPVEAAFRLVPRHLFVPDVSLEDAYADRAIPTKISAGKPISSSSQPAIMAIMLEQLRLEAGQRVLEIGAGTAYNAALIAHIVGEGGEVTTIDLDQDIVEAAQQHLSNAGYERVRVILGDGGYGYPPAAPYDRIILTVGAGDITPAWQQQLKPDGWLVLPLGIAGYTQKTVAFEAAGDHWVSQSIQDCGFMELRGEFIDRTYQTIPVGPVAHLSLKALQACLPDADQVYTWLRAAERVDWETGVEVQMGEAFGPLPLWLALHEPGLAFLTAIGESANQGLVPPLISFSGQFQSTSTMLLAGKEGMAALTRAPEYAFSSGDRNDWRPDQPFALIVRQYGEDESPARRLVQQVQAWQAAGRPSTQGLRIRVYPKGANYQPAPGEYVIDKTWTKLVLDWPDIR